MAKKSANPKKPTEKFVVFRANRYDGNYLSEGQKVNSYEAAVKEAKQQLSGMGPYDLEEGTKVFIAKVVAEVKAKEVPVEVIDLTGASA